MFRFLSFLFILFFTVRAGYGQIAISGKVNDRDNVPVSFATIGVFTQADSSYVTGTTTDDKGTFKVSVLPADYFLKVTMIGYADAFAVVKKSKKDVRLAAIILKDDAAMIEEVVVKSDKPQMELQLDKKVFNVSANTANAGANATEVLENIPSVTVDAEGKVSLRGKENVRIMIDGKFSGLASTPDALQQLQASMIDKVEVVTNASARYDAQGEAGIINIILKKNKKAGWNGSINANAAYNPQFGGGFNVNYRKGNLNLFGNYSSSHRNQPGTSNTYQRYRGADTSFTYEQEYKHTRKKLSNNAMAGADYSFNERNVLSATFLLSTGLGDNFYVRKYNDLNTEDRLIGYSLRNEAQKEIEDFYEGSLSYKKTFARKGQSWNVNIKWSSDQDLERSDYDETNTYVSGTELQRSSVNTHENTTLIQTDYIHPIFKEGKIEAGYRSTLRHISNEFAFSQLVGDEYVYPVAFNDHYRYLEDVHAAYVMAGNKFGSFSVQAGLRGELSDITTRQESLNKENNRTYFNLFPSLALGYELAAGNTLQLSYSRRVNRPGQWELLPFTKFGDNREMMLGNPQLNPEFTHSAEAGFLRTWDKGSLLSSLYYRNTSNVIQRLRSIDESGLVLILPENLARENSYGFEFNFNYNFFSWLKFNSGLNLFRRQTSGSYQGVDLSSDAFTLTNRSALNATIAGVWKAQSSFNYRAPQTTTQGRELSNYFMDMSVSRDLLEGNATIVFNIRDVFNTRRWRGITDNDEFYTRTSMQWRPRSFQLSFTYRFNQKPGQERKQGFDEGMGEG